MIDPEDILHILEASRKAPGAVHNGICKITDEKLFRMTSIPKVVARPDGRLLYMSRGPVPQTKRGEFRVAWRQICVYS